MGTAPKMTDDLRQIVEGVQAKLPDVRWEQLPVTHAADDDGLWFFTRAARGSREVQIQSSSGTCPFLIETDVDDKVRTGRTPDEVIRQIVALLI
jgi:hypothetical protein